MAAPRTAPTQTLAAAAARRASWLSLLAVTTLGVGADQLRAHITASEGVPGRGQLRLIVQSYRRDALAGGGLPGRFARPLASTQRLVTDEELRHGVDVRLLQLAEGVGGDDAQIVAWVESGGDDLELDALEARPQAGAFYGVAQDGTGELVLRVGAAG